MATLDSFGPGPVAGRDDPVPAVRVRSAAFLSDIHANVPAFAAVLAELADEPVDALVLNGDITWGTYPSATVDLILAAREQFDHVVLIRGNGDRAVMELVDGVRPATTPREVWMPVAHSARDSSVLRDVVFQASIEVDGVGVVRCCHGSPRADLETITPGTPIERLAEATAGVDADVLLTGHTHLQFIRALDGRIAYSVNPGSVGIPYGVSTPGARWLRMDAGRGLQARTTEYDIDAYIDGMLATDDPGRDRIAALLRTPPTLAEIVAHAEEVFFAD
jgi:putative phosphoesterase